MMHRTIVRLATLALILTSLAPLEAAHAITYNPIKVSLEGDPGEILSGTINVSNNQSIPVTMNPIVLDFTSTREDEKGIPNFDVPTNYLYGLKDWVTFENAGQILAPGASAELRYLIQIPMDASPGGHYGAVLFQERDEEIAPGDAVAIGITGLTGPLLLLRVNGDVTEEGTVLEFYRDKTWYSSLPTALFTRFQNGGSVHLQPSGFISVTNMWGNEVARLNVNEEQGNVLPGTVRRFDNTWQRTELPADTAEIVKEWKNFGFGKYRAELTFVYGTGNVTLDAAQSFWIIPWQLIILAFVALIVVLLLVKGYNRTVVKRAMRRAR